MSENQSSTAITRVAGEAQPITKARSDAGAALQQAARSEVEGRYLMARRFPRSIIVAEQALLEDCKRPGFAALARYSRPVGGKENAEGFSIRFAEAALQRFGNMTAFSHIVAEDEDNVTLRAGCLDYETNAEWHVDVLVPKTQERRTLKDGQKPLATRRNSWGDTVYIVPASAADVQKEIARATSIYCRTAIMRMIPRDVQETCERQVAETQSAEVKSDPAAAMKRLVEAFRKDLSIAATDLEAFVGHSLDKGLTPDEIVELRAVYVGVKEGMVKWREILAERTGTAAATAEEGAAAKPSMVEELKSKVEARKKERTAKAAATTAKPAAEGAPAAASTAPPPHDPKTGEVIDVDPQTGERVPPAGREPGEDE